VAGCCEGDTAGCYTADWWRESLVFIVLAILARSGVIIVVAPYAKLMRQLVTRCCIDAGLDCKHWPEAQDSWPRVVLVSAEAASSDDFLQWAADLRVWQTVHDYGYSRVWDFATFVVQAAR
jgi:hypothetical protein